MAPSEGLRGGRSLAASREEVQGLVAFLPFVMGVLRRCRVAERDVPDIAQDILVQLLPWWVRRFQAEAAAPDGAAGDTGRGYVRVVSRRAAGRLGILEARRGERLGFEADSGDEGDEHPTGDQATSRSGEDLMIEAQEAAGRRAEMDLDRLAGDTQPACWRAFYAHMVAGASVAQIAEGEQAPLSTIYNRIQLARGDLRAAILRRRAAEQRG